ncbi:MAG: 4Fe-4S binding protein [bacterium]
MVDVYRRLARRLDEMPNRFPATESGVELKILRKIFTPQEAETWLRMKTTPETVEQVADRLGRPVPEVQDRLDTMVKKGQIGSFKLLGQQIYAAFPFLPGIYEFQSERMDEELARLIEEYYPRIMSCLGSYEPRLIRTIPVRAGIRAEQQVLLHEDVRRMIKEAKCFQLVECLCRKQMGLLGKPCRHKLETCLMFSSEEDAFLKYTRGRLVSKEDALEVVEDAGGDGLVHLTVNVQSNPVMFLCNCCPCCCIGLRAVRNLEAPYLMAGSGFVCRVDAEACSSCGVCADRCPMDAIVEEPSGYRVLGERCIGCGVCTSTCPSDAMTLVRMHGGQYEKPPANLMEFDTMRAAGRAGAMLLR